MRDIEESSLARLTIPDVLTPVQYYGVRTQHPGTHAMKRLMLAVLEDALRCIQTYAENPNPVHRKAFAEAETWILDYRAQGPFAFGVICDVLGIEPNRLRDGIREWRTQLSNGADSRRLQRHSMRRNDPLWVRWSAGSRTILDRHAAKQTSYALRAKYSIRLRPGPGLFGHWSLSH